MNAGTLSLVSDLVESVQFTFMPSIYVLRIFFLQYTFTLPTVISSFLGPALIVERH